MLQKRNPLWRVLALIAAMALVAVACGDDDDVVTDDEADAAAPDEPDPTLCGGTEFTTREDGMLGLQDEYGFEFPNVTEIDDALVYNEVAQGNCLFGSIFATDGRIGALDLVVLEDDQGFFPPFQAAVVVREDAYDPAMDDLFNPIATALDDDTMVELNSRVSVDEEDPADVAQEWLEQEGLLPGDGTPLEGVSITVGSKEFDEQYILGHMTRLVLEDAGADVSDEIGLIGSDIVRQALEGGDIDIMWEYLGTAWVTYLGNEEAVSADPQEQVEALRDEDEGFVWLEPTGFNNTYGIAMTREQSENLGLSSLSDVAEYTG